MNVAAPIPEGRYNYLGIKDKTPPIQMLRLRHRMCTFQFAMPIDQAVIMENG